MARVRRLFGRAVVLGLLGLSMLLAWGYARQHPQDMPWTPLDLTQPVGAFTRAKLVNLGDDGPTCRALLTEAGVEHDLLPALGAEGQCGYAEAVRLTGGAADLRYRPRPPGTQCAVAAALALWEWHVVQPAAQRHFGQRVAGVDHLGSYSCRRLYGREEGDWSQHATANAIDISGFRLADGTRISVLRDWDDGDPAAAFLREVRDGACDLFSTVLSPDYNAAHRDHFHFDQAQRGGWSGGVCR